MNVDFIVVGRGLAGSTLSLKLVDAGYSIVSIDDPALSSCSKVSAGMINPLVFFRLTLAWRAKEAIAVARDFYTSVEERSGMSFFHQTGMGRVFGSQHEADTWKKLCHDANFQSHLGEPGSFEPGENIKARFGAALVKTAGHLDTQTYLKAVTNLLSQRATLLEEKFNAEELHFSQDGVRYKAYSALGIILSEGWKASECRWFGNLPFKPAKGESIVVRAEGLPDLPFSGGVFAIPIGDKLYKIGGTYEWGKLDETPSAHQKEDLVKRLSNLISVPFELVQHVAGIRPTISDRRPLLGQHPEIDSLYIFNGLGTRGAMMAPLLAEEMTQLLLYKKAIPTEASISRF